MHGSKVKRSPPGSIQTLPVAAILPVSGRPAMLSEALHSITAGTGIPAEIVVVIDSLEKIGNPDELSAVKFGDSSEAVRSGRIEYKIIHTSGLGPGPARNAGAAASHSSYLAFLDSDDLWNREKLEFQFEYLRKRPHLQAVCTRETWIKNGKLLTQPAHLQPLCGRFFKDSLSHCLISPSSLLISRQVFQEMDGYDPDFFVCEDFEFNLRYLSTRPIGLVPLDLTIKRSGDWPQLSARHSLDRERIRAILKTVKSSRMKEEERERAKIVCMEKLQILMTGAAKRGVDFAALEELRNEIATVFH